MIGLRPLPKTATCLSAAQGEAGPNRGAPVSLSDDVTAIVPSGPRTGLYVGYRGPGLDDEHLVPLADGAVGMPSAPGEFSVTIYGRSGDEIGSISGFLEDLP